MDEQKAHEILKIIGNSIAGQNFEWRLDGSINLLIRGIKVEPKDIDIRTWENGIKIFREHLKQFIIQDFYNEKKKAWSLILNILGEEVEINCYTDWNEDKDFKLENIKLGNFILKCPSLKDLERMYRNIGRTKEADKIKEILSRNQ